MAGAIARQYEAAVHRILPGYAVHREYSISDRALMTALAVHLPFNTNPELRAYARSQMANLQRRIFTLRATSSPVNTRRRSRRLIEPVPGDLESAAERVEFMVNRFETFGIARSFPNGRRMESLQYNSIFTRTSRYLNEFWSAALQAIRNHIVPFRPNSTVSTPELSSPKTSSPKTLYHGR
jgi:hypothetical protein